MWFGGDVDDGWLCMDIPHIMDMNDCTLRRRLGSDTEAIWHTVAPSMRNGEVIVDPTTRERAPELTATFWETDPSHRRLATLKFRHVPDGKRRPISSTYTKYLDQYPTHISD
jgi:hypothetical protein